MSQNNRNYQKQSKSYSKNSHNKNQIQEKQLPKQRILEQERQKRQEEREQISRQNVARSLKDHFDYDHNLKKYFRKTTEFTSNDIHSGVSVGNIKEQTQDRITQQNTINSFPTIQFVNLSEEQKRISKLSPRKFLEKLKQLNQETPHFSLLKSLLLRNVLDQQALKPNAITYLQDNSKALFLPLQYKCQIVGVSSIERSSHVLILLALQSNTNNQLITSFTAVRIGTKGDESVSIVRLVPPEQFAKSQFRRMLLFEGDDDNQSNFSNNGITNEDSSYGAFASDSQIVVFKFWCINNSELRFAFKGEVKFAGLSEGSIIDIAKRNDSKNKDNKRRLQQQIVIISRNRIGVFDLLTLQRVFKVTLDFHRVEFAVIQETASSSLGLEEQQDDYVLVYTESMKMLLIDLKQKQIVAQTMLGNLYSAVVSFKHYSKDITKKMKEFKNYEDQPAILFEIIGQRHDQTLAFYSLSQDSKKTWNWQQRNVSKSIPVKIRGDLGKLSLDCSWLNLNDQRVCLMLDWNLVFKGISVGQLNGLTYKENSENKQNQIMPKFVFQTVQKNDRLNSSNTISILHSLYQEDELVYIRILPYL